MPPKLSIVTPSLNQGAFIERTIRSVLDQGYPNLEYVIVDGGSTDETVEIIRRYEDRLAWWVSEPDEGQTDAINKGIERTTGEIVAYINSDDYYLPGAFEKAVAGLEGTQAKWISAASIDVDENDRPTGLAICRPYPPSRIEGLPRGRQWWLIAPWHVPQPSVFWRRELFDRHGLFRRDMHFAFDAEFMVRMAFAGELPELLPDECLAARVFHAAAKSWDLARWDPEIDLMVQIHGGELSPREHRRVALTRRLRGTAYFRWRYAVAQGRGTEHVIAGARRTLAAPFRAAARLKSRLGIALRSVLRSGGNLLEYVPARLRGRIRHRDRLP